MLYEPYRLLAGFLVQFSVPISLHGIGPSYLKDHLSPIVSACPVALDRMGMLQVPLIKQGHLSAAFSVAAPAF